MSGVNERPTVVRTCKCECGEVFNWPVEFSATTPKLSGEARRSCPKCGRDATFASPWRLWVNGQLRLMDIGDRIEEGDPYK